MVMGQLANGFITMMLAKLMLNDVPHALLGNPGNPGNPGSLDTDIIIARAGLGVYVPPPFFPKADVEPTRHRKPPKSVRIKDVGSYRVRMETRDDSCSIKLYEFLEGWQQKTRATWTGEGKAVCEAKFEQVVDVIKQVRFESKTQMLR